MDPQKNQLSNPDKNQNRINPQHFNEHSISSSYDNIQKTDQNNMLKNLEINGYQSDIENQDILSKNQNHQNINDVCVNQSINVEQNKAGYINTNISNPNNLPQRDFNPPPKIEQELLTNLPNLNQMNTIITTQSNKNMPTERGSLENKIPYRYMTNRNPISTTSRSNKSISNPPVFISFGCIAPKSSQSINKPQSFAFNSNVVSNPPEVNRERIISQTTARPMLIIPGNRPPSQLPPLQKPLSQQLPPQKPLSQQPPPQQPPMRIPPLQLLPPQVNPSTPGSPQRQVTIPPSNIIHRSPSIQYAYPLQINTARPVHSPLPQQTTNAHEFRRFVSFSNVESHPSIQQQTLNVSLVEQPPQAISSFRSGQLQSLHLLSPQNSSKLISIQHYYTGAITKYLQLSNKIHIIKQITQGITQLINIMIREQISKQKQDFLKILKDKQNSLEQKLIDVQREASEVIKENNQFQMQISSNVKQGQHEENAQNATKNQLNSELEKYKAKISQLIQTNTKYQQEIEKYKHQGMQFQKKYRQQQQLKQSNRSQQKLTIQQQLAKTIENQKIIIKKLQQELIQAHKQENQKNIEIVNQKTQLKNLEGIYQGKKKAQQEKLMTLIESKVAYITELQAQIIRYKTQIRNLKQVIKQKQKNDRDIEIEQKVNFTQSPPINIKKTSSDTLEITKLQKTISDKNEQLDKVKQKIFEIQQQFDQVIDEKNEKIKELHEQIMELNKKQVQTSSLHDQNSLDIKSINIKEMQDELQNLKNMILSKQQQLQQLKQLTIKKTQLQQQIEQLRNETIQQNKDLKQKKLQKQKLQQILNNLQNKINHYNKQQNIQEQINMMLDTIKKKQMEIIKMRQIIQGHVKNIKQLENQIKDLTVKYKDIQYQLFDQKKCFDKYPHQNHKIKQIQKQIQKNCKNCDLSKLKSMVKDLKKKIKQIQDGNHQEKQQKMVQNDDNIQNINRKTSHHDNNKVSELQQIIKTKQQKIKQLQLKLLSQGYNQQQLLNNNEIQYLKKKLNDYQIVTKNPQNLIKSYKIKNEHNIHIFQHQIIYELKKENQKLKNIISGSITNHNKNGQSYVNNIQKRLNQFNIKLQQLILENKQYQRYGKTSRNNITGENDVHEREKHMANRKYQKQIELLQTRIMQLQRYCSSLEACQMPSELLPFSFNQKQYSQQTTVHSSQKTLYYREKNKELEQRVDNLLKLNKELKDKYQQLSKHQNIQDNQYYIQQIKQLEDKIKQYDQKIQEIISKYNNNIHQYEQKQSYIKKINSLQANAKSLSSQISQLQQQKKISSNDTKNYQNKITKLEDQLINMKISQMDKDQKINTLQNTIQKNNSNIYTYQQQIKKQTNNLKVFKKEIEKLEQELLNKKYQEQNNNNQLKSKNSQLEREIAHLKREIEQSKQDKINSQRAYDLDRKLSSAQYQMKELAQKNKDLKVLADMKSNEMARLNQMIKKLQQQNSIPKQIKNQLQKLHQLTVKLHNQILALQAENAKLQAELAVLSKKSKHSQKCKYEIQMIRSVFIEMQNLIKQLSVKVESREQEIGSKLIKEIGKGFYICEEINNLF